MTTLKRIPNAKKWTLERVTEELDAIKHHAYQEDVDTLGIALVKQGLYKQLWAYWKHIFEDNDDIIEDMLVIEHIFESRISQAALHKKISPWIAMFVLKNNHNWTDNLHDEKPKQEAEPTIYWKTEDEVVIVHAEQSGIYRREGREAA